MIPIKPGASLAALPDDQAERAARVASLAEDALGSRDPSMIAEVCAILIARARLRRLDLPPETMRMAEAAAAVYSRAMPELTRGAILSTVAEIVTQFRTEAEAFHALPYLLRVQ